MTQKSLSFNDFAIDTAKGHGCRINFWFMNKSQVVDRMKNADLSEKSGQIIICHETMTEKQRYHERNKGKKNPKSTIKSK